MTSTGLARKQPLARAEGQRGSSLQERCLPHPQGPHGLWGKCGPGGRGDVFASSLGDATAPGKPPDPGHGSIPVQHEAVLGCRWPVLGMLHSPHTTARHLGQSA